VKEAACAISSGKYHPTVSTYNQFLADVGLQGVCIRWNKQRFSHELTEALKEFGGILPVLSWLPTNLMAALVCHYSSFENIRREFNIKQFHEPNDKPYAWGYVLGTLCSDGTKPGVDKSRGKEYRRIKLNCTDREYVELFVRAVKEITGKTYAIGYREYVGGYGSLVKEWKTVVKVNRFITYIENLGAFGTYDWRVPKIVLEGNENVKRGFVNAYFDGDGSAYLRKDGGITVKFVSSSQNGLLSLQKLFDVFSISSNLRQENGYFYLYIWKKKDVAKYWEAIGVTLTRKKQSFKRARFIPLSIRGEASSTVPLPPFDP